ncbi:MAG: hypothetical protein ACTSYL_08520 [Candidatus Thorarchaeota archaeon]
MTLFSEDEKQRILKEVNGKKGSFLITFRNRHGPTRLERLWGELLHELGVTSHHCINWWSSSGTIGLLECDTDEGLTIYGQWMLHDTNELLGVFHLEEDEAIHIKDGFDSGNVSSAAMRAIRIGETGDQD